MTTPKVPTCPIHKSNLIPDSNYKQYGKMICPIEKCDIAFYTTSKTSTPADSKTRIARLNCHNLVDPLWKSGLIGRTNLYANLGDILGKKPFHIGQCNYQECQKIMNIFSELRNFILRYFEEIKK
jgi:hypothetical protein